MHYHVAYRHVTWTRFFSLTFRGAESIHLDKELGLEPPDSQQLQGLVLLGCTGY